MFNVDFYSHYYASTHSVMTATNFELTMVKGISKPLLTDLVRIEQNRGFSNAKGFKEYLIFRTQSSWAKSLKTGLRPWYGNSNVYYGDIFEKGRKHLIIAVFSDDRQNIRLDFYRGFYPLTPNVRDQVLGKYSL